jgi:hypothetical protein
LSDLVEAPKHVLLRFPETQFVLSNLEAERYYRLDQIGTQMWQVVTAVPSVEDAYSQLIGAFDVAAERFR